MTRPMPEIVGAKVRSISSMEELQDVCMNGVNNNTKASSNISIIDFYATWCPPCRMAAPVFAKMSMESEYSNIQFLKVNVDQAKDVARHYKVSAMPTFILLQGTTAIETQVGWSERNVRNMLNNNNKASGRGIIT